MAKAAFNKKETFFTSKLDLNLRKKLVKCYIWSMALYGAGYQVFPRVECGRGVRLNPHPLIVPRSKNRVELYLYCP
jgi:hypothetical protein